MDRALLVSLCLWRFVVAGIALGGGLACASEDAAPPNVSSAGGRGGEGGGGRGGAQGAAGGDAGVRDAQPYERPPQPAMVSGHGWTFADIGVPAGEAGSLRFAANLSTLRAGGSGLKGAVDGLGLASARLRGDGEIVARVRTLQMVDPESTAGLAIRADAMSGAIGVFVGILGDQTRGGQVVVRRTAGAASEVVATDVGLRAGQFLRIRRNGKRVSVARSPDRLAWVSLASFDLDLPGEVLAGVAASSARPGTPTVAEFDQLRLLQIDAAGAALGMELELLAGNGAIATVTGSDVTVMAGGDNFVTVGEPGVGLFTTLTGAQTVTARIDGLGAMATPRARVGLTFREGGIGRASVLARHAMISLDMTGKVAFQRRDRSTNFDPGVVMSVPKLPIWLRLVRYDDPIAFRTRVMGQLSSDGVTFTALDTVEMKLADPTLVGVVFTSGDANLHTTLRLSQVAIAPTTAPIAGDSGLTDAAADSNREPRPDAGVDVPMDVGSGQ